MPSSYAREAMARARTRAVRAVLRLLARTAARALWLEWIPVGAYLRATSSAPLERMRAAQRGLDPEMLRAEKEFLAYGDGLMRLAANCKEILFPGETLLAVGGSGENNEALCTIREWLEHPLAFVSDFAFDHGGLRTSAARIAEAVAQILRAEEELLEALKPLVHLRTHFHIESARLTNEIFGSMDQEIENLQRSLQTQFMDQFAELRALREALAGFAAEYDRRSVALAARVQSKRTKLEQIFDQVRAGVAESRRLQTDILNAVQRLNGEINLMVVAMQAQDAVMQRLTHARRGLAVLLGKFGELEHGNLGVTRRELPNVAAIARLEAAQIKSAHRQLSEAAMYLLGKVEGVPRGIRQFEDCRIMQEHAKGTAGVQGMVQVLVEGIEDAHQLVRDTAEAAGACSESLRPLGAVVDGLSQEMDHAGEYMRRLALNFQLAAARYGNGTGLEVLAVRMASISEDVSRICAAADRQVRGLAGDLRQTLDGFARITEEGMRMTELSGVNENKVLHSFCDATVTALYKVGEVFDMARQTAANMQAADFNRMCGKVLPEMEASVDAVAALSEDLCETLCAHELHPDELRAFRKQYTMESERQVHLTCFEELDGSPGGTPDLVGAGVSDLGFNVELF